MRVREKKTGHNGLVIQCSTNMSLYNFAAIVNLECAPCMFDIAAIVNLECAPCMFDTGTNITVCLTVLLQC